MAPRLTAVATSELVVLDALLAPVVLPSIAGSRLVVSTTNSTVWSTSALYHRHNTLGVECPKWRFIWHSITPLRVKFFVWFLIHDRLQTRVNILGKTLVNSTAYEVYVDGTKDANHLFFYYSFARLFWTTLSCSFSTLTVTDMPALPRPPCVPTTNFNTFLLLYMWRLWNHRHDVVLRACVPSLSSLLQSCIDDATLWRRKCDPRIGT